MQHIAFASRDIVATVKRLRQNGVTMLPIPENYYDDLEARIDLPRERLDLLRAHDILYDRDDFRRIFAGLHLEYRRSVLFRDRRAPRLPGFGAVNAPIRLAAQARLSSGAGAVRLAG